jgi:hypothetical protein
VALGPTSRASDLGTASTTGEEPIEVGDVALAAHIDESGTQTSIRAVPRSSSDAVLAGSAALTTMRLQRMSGRELATALTAGATSGAAITRTVGHPAPP